MADWKDKFREGTFRGVPFKTESHEVTGGRRKQKREFANRDNGNTRDLGKKLLDFRLELLVIGDDYFAQRDALEAALNEEGPGELIHPYRGTIQVQAGVYRLAETVTEGRMARFSVDFSESGDVKFPDQVEDDLNNSLDNADALVDDSKGFFATVFSVAGQAAFVVNAGEKALEAGLDFATGAVAKVTTPVTEFAFAISNMKARIGDLARAPGEFADLLDDAFNLLIDEFEDTPETSERIFGGFATIDDSFVPVIGDTPSRVVQQGNQDATVSFFKQMGLANQARSAVDIDFTSTSAALQSRDAVVSGLDLELDTLDDDLFQSIKELQTSLTRAIPRTGTSELITIIPPKTIPALVIAHAQFEDLAKEDEIVEQNAIEHPGFVPGGDAIQVSAS